MVFAPMEVLSLPFTLFILRRGIAARRGRVLAKGSVWGEDFIVHNDELVDSVFAAALTYAEVLALSFDAFQQILTDHADFADVERAVSRARVFYTVRARLMLKGREIFEEKKKRGAVKKSRGMNIISRSVGHRGMTTVRTETQKGMRFGNFSGPNALSASSPVGASPPAYGEPRRGMQRRASGLQQGRDRYSHGDAPTSTSPTNRASPPAHARATFPATGQEPPSPTFTDVAVLPGDLPAHAGNSAATTARVTPTTSAADAAAVAPFDDAFGDAAEPTPVEPVSPMTPRKPDDPHEAAMAALARARPAPHRDDLAVADVDDADDGDADVDDLDAVARSLG